MMHYSKFNNNDISSKRPIGQAASSSPKQSVSTTNKLFLKGFHQEHKKLFHQADSSSNMASAAAGLGAGS